MKGVDLWNFVYILIRLIWRAFLCFKAKFTRKKILSKWKVLKNSRFFSVVLPFFVKLTFKLTYFATSSRTSRRRNDHRTTCHHRIRRPAKFGPFGSAQLNGIILEQKKENFSKDRILNKSGNTWTSFSLTFNFSSLDFKTFLSWPSRFSCMANCSLRSKSVSDTTEPAPETSAGKSMMSTGGVVSVLEESPDTGFSSSPPHHIVLNLKLLQICHLVNKIWPTLFSQIFFAHLVNKNLTDFVFTEKLVSNLNSEFWFFTSSETCLTLLIVRWLDYFKGIWGFLFWSSALASVDVTHFTLNATFTYISRNLSIFYKLQGNPIRKKIVKSLKSQNTKKTWKIVYNIAKQFRYPFNLTNFLVAIIK